MTTKINIEADLVVCQTQLRAEPGDRLLIWKGVCLGLYRGVEPSALRSAADAGVSEDAILKAYSRSSVPMSVARLNVALGLGTDEGPVRSLVSHRVHKLAEMGRLEVVPSDRLRQHIYRLPERAGP